MAKVRTVYVCQNCGAEHSKWAGQCSQCGEWNTLVEEISQKSKVKSQKLGGRTQSASSQVVRLSELKHTPQSRGRILTGSGEFDRVLGGGIVPGSVVLVGGEPGIGKSTLLTQVAMKIVQGSTSRDPSAAGKRASSRHAQDDEDDLKSISSSSNKQGEVLYVCGEESVNQVGLRVDRLGEMSNDKDQMTNLLLMAETDVDVVVATIEQEKPVVVIIDSIQTMTTGDLTGMAGSVGQVRESALRLITVAKQTGTAVFLVGHVTKEGSIAGPKVLEHMIDAVVTITGERTGLWRILRTFKNRFGPTDEVGVMRQGEAGMEDVVNPSEAFLEESQQGKPGSVVVVLMEGTRPVLVEVQALCVKSQLAMPRRVVQGVSLNKVQLLAAVLTKQCRLPLGSYDVFVNVVGGLKVTEPAADLGIALAIASSVKDKAVSAKTAVVGEVGLLGEIRRVVHLEKRVKEAEKLGYKQVVGPADYTSVAETVRKVLV
jgi:DNA repair protein RadA/Sms